MIKKSDKIWLDGNLLDWDKANIHVLTHTLHYGLGVFEGIRCYETKDKGAAIFRLDEHVRRLFESAHIFLIDVKGYEYPHLINGSLCANVFRMVDERFHDLLHELLILHDFHVSCSFLVVP